MQVSMQSLSLCKGRLLLQLPLVRSSVTALEVHPCMAGVYYHAFTMISS